MTTAPPTTAVPTTVAPTTLAPTTLAPSTGVPTTTLTTVVPTTLVPTTAVPGVDIYVDPIELTLGFYSAFHYNPPMPANSGLNIYYEPDPIELSIDVIGSPGNVGIQVQPIDIVISVVGQSPVVSTVIRPSAIDLIVSIHSFITELVLELPKCNFVKWSKIGRLDFTIDESNLAGERPLDWHGCVWHLKRLGNGIVAYGENGVTILNPSGVHWGMDTVYRLGIKNKGAMTGDETIHFFVDKIGQLFQLDNKLTKLDYSEFLSTMGTIVLSLDYEKQVLYICDGIKGYVFGVKDKSFGEGPVNVTGFGVQSGNVYVTSDGEIITPKFEICTDIYDLGTRKAKTIRSIEIGTNITQWLYASVDYRIDYTEEFKQIGWFLFNPNGVAFPKCYGHEFRFRLISTVYEYFELDWMKIKGNIHGFSWLDQYGNPADD